MDIRWLVPPGLAVVLLLSSAAAAQMADHEELTSDPRTNEGALAAWRSFLETRQYTFFTPSGCSYGACDPGQQSDHSRPAPPEPPAPAPAPPSSSESSEPPNG